MKKYPIEFTDTIWTYSDYKELPLDGNIYQLLRGVLYMVPSPNSYHQRISRNLEFILWSYVSQNNLGEIFDAPMDVLLSQTDVVQPDIFFISQDRIEIIKENAIHGAPDLVVEILSPSTEKMDRQLKKNLYERHGVYEFLIVNPEEKNVSQFVMKQGAYEFLGTFTRRDELPLKSLSLVVPLAKIF